MDSIFRSSDEVAADPAWTSAAALNRSSSEWAFQKFLEDYVLKSDTASNSNSNLCNDVVEIKKLIPTLGVDNTVRSLPSDLSSAPPVNSNDDYQAFLKRQLDLACAAVARSREPPAKSLESVASPESQTSVSPQVCSQSIGTQDKVDCGTIGIPALPGKVKCSVVQVKSSTSGSSREQSEDDELEGETATNDNMDQSDDKRARRMLSNRESARRSRRRKQEQMSELETQVAQLRVENSSLLKRLTESNQKYSEASVDNRVLKADVETLRAKVMMAEDKVKRVTGLNTPLQPFSDIPSVSMVFNADASNARLNISGSFPPNPSNRMQQTVPAPSNMGMNNAAFSHNANRP